MTGVATNPAFSVEPDADRLDLRAWHETSWWRPAVAFALTFGIWAATIMIGLWTDRLVVRAVMVLPLTLASGQLFTLAHDAGHGSYSTSRVVNALVGRLALIPSVHVYGLWREHHNIHHRYTNLRSRDFVWTPLSVAEYGALSRGQRALHRIYRNKSSLGLGLQYAIEIWAPRMLWPRRHHVLTGRGRLWADTVWLCASLIGLCVSAWGFVSLVEPDKTGDAGFWVSAVALLFLVPLMGTQWLIGFVIYLNHTHPDIRWYGDPTEWDQHRVQLEGSAGQRFPKRTHVVLPRRIMNHTAHHVDPGVPLRRLGEAQQQLLDTVGDRVVLYEWSPRVFRDVLSRCKLYDYDTQRWLTYPDPAEVTT